AGGTQVVVATTVSTSAVAGAAAAPAGHAAGRLAPDSARKRFQKQNVYYVLNTAAGLKRMLWSDDPPAATSEDPWL
ncbi:MAG TPA: hypothetical protein VK324_15220, partial [Tepidisphaeraceae bacterium]|nr:hypothetical protein [Tepidisphaeraceae bacterium]